jgi:hypothetical protein
MNALTILHARGEEGVRALLRVLRGLFVIDQVMPESVNGLRERHREGMRNCPEKRQARNW